MRTTTITLIASCETYSCDDEWMSYEVYNGIDGLYLIEQQHGIGGVFGPEEKRETTIDEVKHLLGMFVRDQGPPASIEDEEALEELLG